MLFQKHNLTVYPGLRTTIKFHEEGLLLAVDAIHKVFSTDTALDVMDKIRREGITDFQAKVKAVLEGRLFTTNYNKKTYRYCFFCFLDIYTVNKKMISFLQNEELKKVLQF